MSRPAYIMTHSFHTGGGGVHALLTPSSFLDPIHDSMSRIPIRASNTSITLKYQYSSPFQPTHIRNIILIPFALSTSLVLVLFPTATIHIFTLTARIITPNPPLQSIYRYKYILKGRIIFLSRGSTSTITPKHQTQQQRRQQQQQQQ